MVVDGRVSEEMSPRFYVRFACTPYMNPILATPIAAIYYLVALNSGSQANVDLV
jgi:predicted Holliday junction resolvase-like endonuclease